MDIEQFDTSDTAMLELSNFKLYNIGSEGLDMMLQGSYAERYSDRYEIRNLSYTNNSVQEQQKIAAALAIYQDKTLYLNGNVIYEKGDNFMFTSDEAQYNEETKSAYTTGKFELKSSDGLFSGHELQYNSESEKVKAKTITAIYHLNKAK